jgi:hypothetical protein
VCMYTFVCMHVCICVCVCVCVFVGVCVHPEDGNVCMCVEDEYLHVLITGETMEMVCLLYIFT